MAGHSVPIDFWVDSNQITNPIEKEAILQKLIHIIQDYSGKLQKVTDGDVPGGHHIAIYASKSMTLSIKMYCNGLVSSTLEYLVPEAAIHDQIIANDDGRQIEKRLKNHIACRKCKVLPAIKRAPPINPYFTTSDDRILEYDVDKILFEEVSNFQKVQIVHTKSYGNILILDDLQNLAESDLCYTHGLMNKSQEHFENKEILILGGGDGALLWELLKEKPTFVTMIDIDETVVKSCREHLRSACGTCMDNYDGPNYKLIIGDAIAYMKKYKEEGRTFDYVFGDLTDIPISKSPVGEHWDFMKSIINLGTGLLKPGHGKYLTHATGIQCDSALQMFEQVISNLDIPMCFTRTNCHVPSFMENWCFYQITPKV